LSYTFTVEPYYSSPAPTSLDADGTGSSSTADDYTGQIGSLEKTINADDTVTLSWTYQGSASFEIEEEDQSDPGTNYFYVESTTGRSATLGGLNPGDDYSFRTRSDNADGTASGYQETSADIPSESSDDDGGHSGAPPSLSGATESYSDPGYWYGSVQVSAPQTSDGYWYGFQWVCTGREGDPLNLEDADVDVIDQGVGTNGVPGDGSTQTEWLGITGSTGATYSLAGQLVEEDGSDSEVSGPMTQTLPGTPLRACPKSWHNQPQAADLTRPKPWPKDSSKV
jgi:hypothetical protein